MLGAESFHVLSTARADTLRRYVRASMTLAGLLPPLSDNGNSKPSLPY